MLVIILLLTLGLFYFQNRQKEDRFLYVRKKEDLNTLFLNLLLIGIFFQILAIERGVVTRVTSYFLIGLPIIFPNYIYKIKNEKTKMLFCLVILICSVLYLAFITPTIGYSIELLA